MKIYDDIHSAYLGTLEDIWFNPQFRCAPRGLPIREILNYTFTISRPEAVSVITKDIERNKAIAEYTKKEMELYNSGSNRVEDFAKASKFWNQLANPDGTVNSAYGFLIWKYRSHGNAFEPLEEINGEVLPKMRTPWEWSVESLKADKDTRQAILRFSLPEHFWMGNKDMTCTTHGNFLIRNNELHFTVVMRSNDWNKGILYDLPFFCSLMDKMLEELKSTYPTLTKGSYTHLAHSAHIYEKDAATISKMLGK